MYILFRYLHSLQFFFKYEVIITHNIRTTDQTDIVVITTFRPICFSTFFRCFMSNSVVHTESRFETFVLMPFEKAFDHLLFLSLWISSRAYPVRQTVEEKENSKFSSSLSFRLIVYLFLGIANCLGKYLLG